MCSRVSAHRSTAQGGAGGCESAAAEAISATITTLLLGCSLGLSMKASDFSDFREAFATIDQQVRSNDLHMEIASSAIISDTGRGGTESLRGRPP